MSRARLVFVGHSYHKITHSSLFFRELLREKCDLICEWDESWQAEGPPITADSINRHAPTHVLFWQQLPHRRELRRLSCKNLIWVPMHDAIDYDVSRWRRYAGSNMKVLNFSDATMRFFEGLGFESLAVRYYPAVTTKAELPPPRGAPQLFFWIRRAEVGWPVLKQLLGDLRPARVILRVAPDPGERPQLPVAEDIRSYNIEVREGWMERGDYLRLLRRCSLFMAPRRLEGIGFAGLEAMAHGLAVIAPDTPTMNEYIRSGETGYLYDPDNPRPLDLSRWRDVASKAQTAIAEGRRRWLEMRSGAVDFVFKPPAGARRLGWRLLRLMGL